MIKEIRLVDLNGPEKMDTARRRKQEILRKIVINDALPLAQHYDLGLEIMLEKDGEKEPLYEKHGRWAFGVVDILANYTKMMFSSRAIRDLSDLAFEGLAYHEVSETFLTRFAAEKFPQFLIAQIKGDLPYSTKESMVDYIAHGFFETQGLVPFRVETANIDYKGGDFEIKDFEEYLSKLGYLLPEIAKEIKEKVEFRDKI